MQHYSVKPIEATLRPSRLLAGLLLLLHMLGALMLLLMPLPWPLRLALLVMLAASLGYHWLRDVSRRLPASVQGLHLAADGMFSVRLRRGGWLPAEVLGSSFVQPWLAVLHLKLERRRMLPVVLLPDALGPEEFRGLRVWWRWGRAVGPELK